jgi:hypothetical protein
MDMENQVAEGNVSREAAIQWHLTSNHYPPITHPNAVPFCVDLIEKVESGEYDYETVVEMPNGASKSVGEIVEDLHLDHFITPSYVGGKVMATTDEIKTAVSPERMAHVLRELLEYITSGRHYERKNPYMVPEVKAAQALLADFERKGIDTCEQVFWLDPQTREIAEGFTLSRVSDTVFQIRKPDHKIVCMNIRCLVRSLENVPILQDGQKVVWRSQKGRVFQGSLETIRDDGVAVVKEKGMKSPTLVPYVKLRGSLSEV